MKEPSSRGPYVINLRMTKDLIKEPNLAGFIQLYPIFPFLMEIIPLIVKNALMKFWRKKTKKWFFEKPGYIFHHLLFQSIEC